MPERQDDEHHGSALLSNDDLLEGIKFGAFIAMLILMLAALFFPMWSTGAIVCMALAYVGLFIGIAVDHLQYRADAAAPDEPVPAPPPPAAPVGLTPDEVDVLLALVPEVSDQTRAQVQLLFKGHLRERQS